MQPHIQGSSSCIPNKRKRGRPRRDESQTQQQVRPTVVTTIDENLIGQVVSGVVEGSFEAGYFLKVKVADTEKQLKGVVFLPNKVSPITPTTDLFPQAKMYAREDISLNQQTPPPQGNQTTLLPDAGVCSEAIDERNLRIKDIGCGSSTEPEGQTLSLMPQFANDDVTKDSTAEGSATLVDFFPTPETTPKQATLSLELFQNETKRSGTEEENKSPLDDVPEELQLELGNKNTSGSAIAAEAKSGFLTNLFEGRAEPDAAPESGFPEATQVDGKDS